MKISKKNLTAGLLALFLALSMSGSKPALAAGPLPVDLGTAANFTILSKAAITDIPTSIISGNVGASPISGSSIGVPCGEVSGTIYDDDAAYTGGGGGSTACRVTDAALLTTAVGNMETAYNDAAGRTPLTEPMDTRTATLGLGTTFAPGIYKWSTDVTITGNITLSGSASDVWIFQIAGDLTLASAGSVGSGVHINLTGGALASNVFWAVHGAINGVTLGTYSTFRGNILSLTQIAMETGAVLNGRALAQTQITLDNNTLSITAPTTLTVTKIVNNNHGGTKGVPDFPLFIDGGSVASGVASTTSAGLHTVSETSGSGYAPTIGGACATDGTITLIAGQAQTCTITNNDIAPTLTVTTIVVGGPKGISDFPLFIDGGSVASGVASTTRAGLHTVSETSVSGYTPVIGGLCAVDGKITLALGDVSVCTITNTYIAPAVSGGGGAGVPPLIDVVKVPSPLSLPGGPGPVTYTYTLRNIGTVPVTNITMVGDSCSPIVLVSGDTNSDAKLDVNETWVYRCSTILSATHTNTVTATGWADGITAVDIASATVIVGIPVVPPLIHVTKVPNPLAFSARGGMVSYTNVVTNPGTIPLSNVSLIDDKCGPVVYISGDTNANSKLDPTEDWIYSCRSNLTKTTTNTVTASGDANGLTARDFAIATVVVSDPGLPNIFGSPNVPGFPNTGLPPEGQTAPWSVLILAGTLLLGSVSLVVVQKKRRE